MFHYAILFEDGQLGEELRVLRFRTKVARQMALDKHRDLCACSEDHCLVSNAQCFHVADPVAYPWSKCSLGGEIMVARRICGFSPGVSGRRSSSTMINVPSRSTTGRGAA